MKNFIPSNSILLLLSVLTLSFFSCNKDEKKISPPPPENELITTAILRVVNTVDSSDVHIAKWVDLTPGDAIGPSQIDTLRLRSNSVYLCSISILDETTTPAGNIGEEVSERRNYHIFCFFSSGLSHFTIIATDVDTNTPAFPFGMNSKITTGDAGNGNLQITLKHQPEGKDGTCNPGSVDFNVTYPVKVN